MATKTKKAPAPTPAVASAIPAAVVGQGNPGIGAVNTGNLMAALAGLQATAAPAGRKGSNDPNVLVNAAEVKNYVKAMADEKDAKARKDASFELLQPDLESKRVELSRQFGRFLNSIDVNGRLKYITPCRYLTIEQTMGSQLMGAFGARFGKYFQAGVEIKVKMSTFETLSQDQQVKLVAGLTTLCASIGVNPFEIKSTLVPTEALDVERVMDPGVEALFREANKAKLVSPIKATLKELGK